MFKFLKRFFSSTEVIENVVVQEAMDGEDALMKNAMLAMKTGKIVYGDYTDGVLTSKLQKKDND